MAATSPRNGARCCLCTTVKLNEMGRFYTSPRFGERSPPSRKRRAAGEGSESRFPQRFENRDAGHTHLKWSSSRVESVSRNWLEQLARKVVVGKTDGFVSL